MSFEEVGLPQADTTQFRIKVETCAVCRTDLHIIEGDIELKKKPIIPGHQVIGTVDQVGEKITKFSVGDLVGIPWMRSTCNKCIFCERGQENLCSQANFNGYHLDGGYAEYMVCSEEFAVKLPASIDPIQTSPLLCAGTIGYRSLQLSKTKNAKYVGLYGFGSSAHIAIQIALHWGCEVFVFTRNQDHQAHAKRLGASWVGAPTDTPPVKLHSSIIFAPAGELVPIALYHLEKSGTIAINAISMSDIGRIKYQDLYFEKNLISVTNSTKKDVTDLIQLSEHIPLHVDTKVFGLEEAPQALSLLKESKLTGSPVIFLNK